MKYLFLAFISVFLFGVQAVNAATVLLEWDSNTEADIDKYQVQVGVLPAGFGPVIDVPHVPGAASQSISLPGIAEGLTFFNVAACDVGGNCSLPTEVSFDIQLAPGSPGNIRITVTIDVSVVAPPSP